MGRRFGALCAVVGLVLSLAACGGGEAADGPVEVRLVVGRAITAVHAPWFIGIDKGFYEAVGLDLQVMPGETSQITVTSTAAGQAEFGSADLSSLILAKANDPDLPVRAVAGIQARAPYAVYSLADGANITSPDDLDGARLYTAATSSLPDLFQAWAEKQGVTGYTFGSAGQGVERQLLVSGRIPATLSMVTGGPEVAAIAAEHGKEAVSLRLADWGMDNFYGTMLFVNDEFAAGNPDVVRDFIAASIRAFEYAFANPEEAAENLQARFPALEAAVSVERLRILEDLVTDGGRLAGILGLEPAKVESTLDYHQDIIEADIDPDTLYTREFQP